MRPVESIPNAERTFEALRSLGYDLNSSIADIIDNAITDRVRASTVSVIFRRKNKKFICRIKDDGAGMTDGVLREAMRLGTETSYDDDDLGRFGMGMKTASLSHCNVLTVISKTKRSEIVGYRWDLCHVKGAKAWSLLHLNQSEIEEILNQDKISVRESGTVVFWDDLYLLDQEYESCGSAKLSENYYFKLIADLKLYLRMVYHRFIDGSASGKRNFKIRVNNSILKPWDPFCRSETNTKILNLKDELSKYTIPGQKKAVKIRAFVLPDRGGFSTPEAWKEAKGLLSWNDSQGYYIYRANRLIRYGGWQATKARDEHDKLARVSIDIDPSLDKLFRITVNKRTLQFPDILFNHLKNKVNPVVVKAAQKVYRKSEDGGIIKNKFRKQDEKLVELSRDLIKEGNITTETKGTSKVTVINKGGEYQSNKKSEFEKYETKKDFEVVCDTLNNGHLWRTICDADEKFKVVINNKHPFYIKIYENSSNKSLTGVIDAFIFSLAYAELFNRNKGNANVFDTFKSVCSKTLEKLITRELI